MKLLEIKKKLENKNKTYQPEEIRISRTMQLIRRSTKTAPGSYFDQTHFKIDSNTSEAVLRAFWKWSITGNGEVLIKDMENLKSVFQKYDCLTY